MQFCKFIECRIGEPVTALDACKNYVLLGAISGYFAVYDIQANVIAFSDKCQKQLIRDCCLHIGARKKFKNPGHAEEETINEMDSEFSSNPYMDDSIDIEKYGKNSSIRFKEATDVVFDFETGQYNFGYLSVGDSGTLRIDLHMFISDNLKKFVKTETCFPSNK